MFSHILKIPIKTLKANYHVKTEVMTFTPKAIARLNHIVTDPDKNAVELNIKKKGCNGSSYELKLINKNDNMYIGEIVKVGNVTMSINRQALTHVMGTQMDFYENEFESGFTFNNPNVMGLCGCGSSVKFK